VTVAGLLLIAIGTQAVACQAKCRPHSMQFHARLRNRGDEPSMAKRTKAPGPENILRQNKTKEKTKCYCWTGADNDDDDGLIAPNPRGRSRSRRPPSRTPG
jgi:hypothetical protein